jgi:hypothetical protein
MQRKVTSHVDILEGRLATEGRLLQVCFSFSLVDLSRTALIHPSLLLMDPSKPSCFMVRRNWKTIRPTLRMILSQSTYALSTS